MKEEEKVFVALLLVGNFFAWAGIFFLIAAKLSVCCVGASEYFFSWSCVVLPRLLAEDQSVIIVRNVAIWRGGLLVTHLLWDTGFSTSCFDDATFTIYNPINSNGFDTRHRMNTMRKCREKVTYFCVTPPTPKYFHPSFKWIANIDIIIIIITITVESIDRPYD